MPTVLLTWELGGGFGHVARLQRVAAVLAPHGIHLMAAVKNLKASARLAADGVGLLQVVGLNTILSDAQRSAKSSATFGDMLADFGLADEETVIALLAAWDRYFALIKPDLVIADYAPTAALAARHRIPLAIVGTGFTVPPAEMANFPLLHQLSPPIWREQDVLAIVNRALALRKAQPVDRLPQIFDCDVSSVQTFPMLDPYQAHRPAPADGPLITMPKPRRADASSIIVYIGSGVPRRHEIVAALRPFGARLCVFAPGLSSEQRVELANAGATIASAPLQLCERLASARLMVHLGGLGVASEALAAGVPQLILSVDIEKELTGAALERAQVGRLIKLSDPAAQLSADLIDAVVSDETIAARAGALSESHRRMLQDYQTLPKFERACLQLLGYQASTCCLEY